MDCIFFFNWILFEIFWKEYTYIFIQNFRVKEQPNSNNLALEI